MFLFNQIKYANAILQIFLILIFNSVEKREGFYLKFVTRRK